MTVEELIESLGNFPADAQVCLILGDGEYEDFTVTTSDDGWVCLEA